ncbi:MAG: amidase family protein [Acuticoccus sp.]
MTIDPTHLSARDLAFRVGAGLIRAEAVAEATLARVAATNGQINAIVDLCQEEALAAAREVDRSVADGTPVGGLAGVPVTIKVFSDQKGHATTNGTTLGRDLIAEHDAPFVAQMRTDGALIVGRTNTPAFSYRWFTSNIVHGTTLNPHNAALTPGGSSGGAAASVAAGYAVVAHGTDIAGSIRYPAYACGVHGLRPTPGRVPAYNASGPERGIGAQLMAVSGPIARRVDDLRVALEAMAGYSPDDPMTAPVPLTGPAVARRVAVMRTLEGRPVDPRIAADIDRAAAIFRAAGWTVEEPTPPPLAEAMELQIDLWFSDAFAAQMAAAEREGDAGALTALRRNAAQAARFDTDRFSEVFRRRSALMRAWRRFTADYPVVLMPVSAELPFQRDEDLAGDAALERIWRAQIAQIALPLVGLPAMSVSTGLVNGVPSGVQLVAAPWREDVCLAAGEVLEAAFGIPPLAGGSSD